MWEVCEPTGNLIDHYFVFGGAKDNLIRHLTTAEDHSIIKINNNNWHCNKWHDSNQPSARLHCNPYQHVFRIPSMCISCAFPPLMWHRWKVTHVHRLCISIGGLKNQCWKSKLGPCIMSMLTLFWNSKDKWCSGAIKSLHTCHQCIMLRLKQPLLLLGATFNRNFN